jgi:hypothetical protein
MFLRILIFRVLLKLFGFATTRRLAEKEHEPSGQIPDAGEVQRLAHFARSIARSNLVESPCLAASLALSWTLGRRGICTTLHLGVQRRNGRLNAHAWLESQGQLLLDTSDGDTFATLVAFEQQKTR